MQKNGIVLSLLGALLAAIVGGVIWALIAVLTNYEIGIIAWAIGGIAGYAVAYSAKYQTSAVHQVIAVAASLIGILLGKYFSFGYLLTNSLDGIFDGTTISLFQELFTEFFGIMDIVFIALAVITAWQLPIKLQQKVQQITVSQ